MPCPPRVLIGAAGSNGPIKGEHFPDWVCGGGARGTAVRSQPNYPSVMPEKHAGNNLASGRRR